MVDVTDTFDAFHRLVSVLWREFGPALSGSDPDEGGIGFDELVDQLELDVFLPACAHRLREATGEVAEPDELAARILLVPEAGEAWPGPTGRYHSHAFHPESLASDVPNAVLTENLMSLERSGLRLQVGPPPAPGRRRGTRRNLPVH